MSSPSSWYRLVRNQRPDTWIAMAIPIGCSALLLEAYTRSDMSNDADNVQCCAYAATNRIITEHHVRQLETNGMVVIPHALSHAELKLARRDIQRYVTPPVHSKHRNHNKNATMIWNPSSNDDDVRQDLVAWIRESGLLPQEEPQPHHDDQETPTHYYPHLLHCVRLVRGVAHALEQQGYNRASSSFLTTRDTRASNDHGSFRVPRPCQLALYPGTTTAGYARHLDTCDHTLYELGLLEWMRLSDYRARSITTILYLNTHDRPASAGGALRCWVAKSIYPGSDPGASRHQRPFLDPVDIVPTGGTLVMFQSDRVEHQVLPSSMDRYALTNWVLETSSA